MSRDQSAFWSVPPEELLRLLDAKEVGLDEKEAQKRLKQYGANLLKPRKKSYSILLLLAQFNSPIILLLVFAAGLSFYLHQVAVASIILTIIFISGLLGFWQERSAADAVAGLLAIIQIKATVLRDGIQKDVLAVIPATCHGGSIQNRMVHRVGGLGLLCCADHSHHETIFLVQTKHFIDSRDPFGWPIYFHPAIQPAIGDLWVHKNSNLFSGHHSSIVGIYIAAAELVKKIFYRMEKS